MSYSTSARWIFATALTVFLAAPMLLAQGAPDSTKMKTTSAQRIRINKEAGVGGEVVVARRDTVTMYRTRVDTVVSYRADTVRMRGRIDTMWTTRYDTVIVAPVAVPSVPSVQRVLDGLYFGVAAGTTSPTGSLFQANNAGMGTQAQLGWNPAGIPLGVRADVNYARFGQDAAYAQTHVNGQLLTGNADLRLALPVLTHLLGLSPRFGLYGIGGLTYASYQNLQMDMQANACCGSGPTNTSGPSSGNKLGWNAGGGATLGWGNKELFVESRLIDFKSPNALSARAVPILLGMNWF
jgi:hypothetical protein